jgi:ribose transport system substrate-binding protein
LIFGLERREKEKKVRRNLKIIAVIFAILTVASAFGGCSRDTDSANNTGGAESATDDSSAREPRVYAVSLMSLNDPFFVSLENGLRNAVEEQGDTLITLDAGFDQNKQISDIEDMIQRGVDCVFMNPVDSAGIKPALEALQTAGIPVIDVDTKCFDEDLLLTQVSGDGPKAGALAADKMAEVLGEEGGNVIIVNHSIAAPARDRTAGFRARAEEAYPQIKITDERDVTPPATEPALNEMEAVLQANKDIQGVFGINDSIGLGIYAAVRGAGREDEIKIISVDGSKDTRDLIAEGRYCASIAMFPYEMGLVAVDFSNKYFAGEFDGKTINKDIRVDVITIDESNTDVLNIDISRISELYTLD